MNIYGCQVSTHEYYAFKLTNRDKLLKNHLIYSKYEKISH